MAVSDALSRPNFMKVIPETRLGKNVSFHITSPFPIGSVLTKEMIEEALQADPEIVKVTNIHDIRVIDSILTKPFNNQITAITFHKEQQTDAEIVKITKKLQQGMTGASTKYEMINELLYRKGKQPGDPPRLYVPEKLLGPLLAMYHIENHMGGVNLAKQMNIKYYYPNLQDAAHKFTKGCHLCAIFLVSREKMALTTNTIHPTAKMTTWSIDENVGFRGSHNGYLCAIEYHTGYKLILPLKTNTGKEVARLLEDHIFSIFPAISTVISDNGTNLLRSPHVQAVCAKYQIKIHLTTAYRPQTHGTVEVAQRETAHLIRVLSEQLNTSWTNVCKLAQLSCNSKVSERLGNFSPNYFMFGIHPHQSRPLSLQLSDISDKDSEVQQWTKQLAQCNKIVEKEAKRKAQINKSRGGKHMEYPPGTFILAKNFSQNKRAKLRTHYHQAPELVEREYPVVVLTRTLSGVIIKRHKANIKLANEREAKLYQDLPQVVKKNS